MEVTDTTLLVIQMLMVLLKATAVLFLDMLFCLTVAWLVGFPGSKS